jgi:VanZ family protein
MKSKLLLLVLSLSCVVAKAQYNLEVKHVHTAAHFTIGFGAGTISSLFGKTQRERIMLGTFSGAVLGVAKEGYDLYHGGKPSLSDFVFTTAGGLVGSLVTNMAIKRRPKAVPKSYTF